MSIHYICIVKFLKFLSTAFLFFMVGNYRNLRQHQMFTLENMAATEGVPLLMRIVAASVSVSHRAARIARDILTKGDLGIVEKVYFMYFSSDSLKTLLELWHIFS